MPYRRIVIGTVRSTQGRSTDGHISITSFCFQHAVAADSNIVQTRLQVFERRSTNSRIVVARFKRGKGIVTNCCIHDACNRSAATQCPVAKSAVFHPRGIGMQGAVAKGRIVAARGISACTSTNKIIVCSCIQLSHGQIILAEHNWLIIRGA